VISHHRTSIGGGGGPLALKRKAGSLLGLVQARPFILLGEGNSGLRARPTGVTGRFIVEGPGAREGVAHWLFAERMGA